MVADLDMTVRGAVMRLFREFGMTTIFGNPGSTELPMFRDFPDDFTYVLGLQESTVVGMADGHALATRNAAAVNLHSAAGVGHALGNIFTARKNQAPMVIIAGQQARSILPYEPFLFAERATEFPQPYVKWAIEPARAEDVPAAVARAYYVAMQPPRGPTFVSVPMDDWDRPCAPLLPRKVARTLRGDPELIAEAAEALAAAKRPALVVGASVANDDAWDETIALAERHRALVYVSPLSGRNSFPEDHRLFAGFLDAFRERIVASLAGHDVIVVLGAPAFSYHVEGEGPFIPEGSRLFQLVDDPAPATWAPTGTAIVTSIRAGVRDLLAGPAPGARKWPTGWARPAAPDPAVLTDRLLMARIAALRPAGAVIVEEAPSTRGPLHDHLPIVDRDGYYTVASGGLGWGVPATVGVAHGRPGTRVISILGDGATMYSSQALWNAAQLDLPITFVIVKNRSYAALIQFGLHFGLHRTVGTRLPDLDFRALAAGHGIPGFAVTDPGDLDAALAAAFARPGPSLVEVNVE